MPSRPIKQAGGIGGDLSRPFEVRKKNAVGPPGQKPGEVILAQMYWKLSEIVAAVDQDMEGIELDFVIVFAGVQTVEI